jgi:hypothetical protein
MKIKLFKTTLPMAVVAFGIAGAMQTNAMSKKATALINKWGYTHLEGENCILTNVMCTVGGGPPCKQGTTQLYDFVSSVSCPNPLSRMYP